jgi:NinB protein
VTFTIVIHNERDRFFAKRAVEKAALGQQVKISKPDRTRDQNAALHGRLGDIADQLPWPADAGELHDIEWWKRRLTLLWLKESKQEVEVIEDLEGDGQFALLLPHTSDLKVDQHAALREFVLMFGAQRGVQFKEPGDRPAPPLEAYDDAS